MGETKVSLRSLILYDDLRNRIEEIRKRHREELEPLEKSLQEQDTAIFDALESGASVEGGKLGARLTVVPGRANPKYKELLVQEVGKDRMKKLVEANPNRSPDKKKLEVFAVGG